MSKDKKKPASTDKDIAKTFGRVLSRGSELIAAKKKLKVLPVSPKLDIALNGGIEEGSWTVISGDPKVGKTTTCLQICKNAQDDGRPVIYIDGESRIRAYNLQGIEGLDLDKFQVVHSPEDGEPLSAEDFLTIAETLIKRPENAGAVLIIDSTSSLIPRAELEEDVSATIRASLPKLMSHWSKKVRQTITTNKIIAILITHYIANTSGYGKSKLADGGNQIQYNADTRMNVVRAEPWEEGGKKIGQIVSWKIDSSSCGASGTECVSHIKFGKGIDKEKEIIDLAESFGLIEKSGAWYSISCTGNPDIDGQKFQGQAKIYEYLVENPAVFLQIKDKLKEMLNA